MAYADIVEYRLNTTIEVEPLRRELEKLVASGENWTSLARQLEWWRTVPARLKNGKRSPSGARYRCGDGSRLKKAVGATHYVDKRSGQRKYQDRITFELAEYICDRLEISYIDIGL